MEDWTGKMHQFNHERIAKVTGKIQHKCHLMVVLVQSILHPLRIEEWTGKMHQFYNTGWRT